MHVTNEKKYSLSFCKVEGKQKKIRKYFLLMIFLSLIFFTCCCSRDGGEDLYDKDGGHWHDLMVRCQPCTVDYDFILRTETQYMDAPYIVNHKMKSRGLQMKTKSWREEVNGTFPYFGRKLKEYESIPDDLFHDIVKHYEKDFEVYGYGFHRTGGGAIVTNCTAAENNGERCC